MDVEFIKSKLKIIREQLQHTFKVPDLWDAIEAIDSELKTTLDAETLEMLLNEESNWEHQAERLATRPRTRHTKVTPAQTLTKRQERKKAERAEKHRKANRKWRRKLREAKKAAEREGHDGA